MHDTTLTRTTDAPIRYPLGAPWNVGDFDAAEVYTLDAGTWFGYSMDPLNFSYAGEPVPSLTDILNLLRDRAGLLLEIKGPSSYPGIEEAIARDLEAAGWVENGAARQPLIVQCFDWEFMRAYAQLHPQVAVGLLGSLPQDEETWADVSSYADWINPSHTNLNADIVADIHRRGFRVSPYTINDAPRMRELMAMGVDGVITDEPARLLLDARSHGFMSVEADVFAAPLPPELIEALPLELPLLSTLYVAHDPQDIRPNRSLRSLYLDPLWERFEQVGLLYPDQVEPLQLIVDFKTEAETTWLVLKSIRDDYAPMLTHYADGQLRPGMVTVVISGNRPTHTLAAEAQRLAFIDGRLTDLDAFSPVDLMPLISDNWGNHFSWRGEGPMPDEERAKLIQAITQTQAQGARLRFWATPDAPGPARQALWATLADAGLDHINTDDLADFLRQRARDTSQGSGTPAP